MGARSFVVTLGRIAMEATAPDYFSARLAEYDSLVRRAVPDYDAMIDRMIAYLPERADRILELGAGTGNLSVALARRYPESRLTLVDASEEMLAFSALRVADPDGVHTICKSFEELELVPESFDLVTSCLSVHHVVDKAALFRSIRATLVPDGTFLLADQMRGQADRHHALNWNTMVEFWRRAGHLSPAEQASLAQHAAEHDHYVSIGEHVALLAAAGFEDLDVVWRSWMWGIVTGTAGTGS